jgi:predicted HNH restriction endonuclease
MTLSWLASLRARLPRLAYSEAMHYAAFRVKGGGRAIAYVNPAKRSIRLFLPLGPDADSRLRATPSTSSWARRFPSVFRISGERDLPVAARMIARSRSALHGTKEDRRSPTGEDVLLPGGAVLRWADERALEGLRVEALQYSKSRSGRLRREALRVASGVCATCRVDFSRYLDGRGERVLQVHHQKQLAATDVPRLTLLSDLAVLCANCHALIHADPLRALPVGELHAIISQAPSTGLHLTPRPQVKRTMKSPGQVVAGGR